ncbi:PadR family transcriptional regulator [Lacticaseibacillus daqingensis]|uniref:PadR family transcriptional regulator n=1 Tax=Lacticaseibacillus daqingensis TaxID=2486014 RepID=UPI000F78C9A8|nr:PadR family transcriptional regulator [Lacticaseibacillus daqingensis]
MKQSQLIKGVLEGCVLSLIGPAEVYGYELIQALRENGFENLVGGTLYPLLAKLEQNGELISTMRPSPDGPDRKYYRLTPAGWQAVRDFKLQWETLVGHVETILERVNTDEQG